MSKVLFICYREKMVPNNIENRLENIQKAIFPDNIVPEKIDLISNENIISCIMNPVPLDQRKGNSICLGVINQDFWWEENASNDILDGSYAIFKDNENFTEFQTDAVASRTIWYYFDDQLLIGSNSQLAIIYYLKSFKFNKKVIPWMLSSGTLGPNLSWDERIYSLKPQSKLILNKKNWSFKTETKKIEFSHTNKDDFNDNDYLEQLSASIEKSIHTLPMNKSLLLPLSGGYDSRGILLSLYKIHSEITTITWGNKKAVHNKKNDAYIAGKLAESFQTKHSYVHTENIDLNVEDIIDRFLVNSEGRVDHIAGYLDGFKIWKDIFENDFSAVIRGDEGFGWGKIYSEKQARTSCGLYLMEDFEKLKIFGIEHILPAEFERQQKESSEAWRDRLYHTFRLPTILGALNETKSAYVEILNPLLSYSILKLVRTMPDRLRTDKRLFRTYVENKTPPIPFASEAAIGNYTDKLKSREYVDYFIDTIMNSNYEIIEKSIIEELIKKVRNRNNVSATANFKKLIRKNTPHFIKNFLKAKVDNIIQLDDHLLLFRIFILYRMNEKISKQLKF